MGQEEAYDGARDAHQSYSEAVTILRKELESFQCVEVGRSRLYHADIKDIYHLLPKADCLATDPPYRLTSGGNGEASRKHSRMLGGWAKDYDNKGCPVECDITWEEVLKICYTLCATDSDAYVMANDKNLLPCLKASESAGFSIHNILIWDKINATPNRWYMKNAEFTAYLWKGKAKKINDCGSKQLVRIRQIDETKHPTEKPVELFKLYIANSSKENDTIIDPFMGSGTTGVAALALNRNFIGVEKDKAFFDMAVKRLQAATQKGQDSLFQN